MATPARSDAAGALRVVEFYSGIGGHHAALGLATKGSGAAFRVVRAFDMSEHAKRTYEAYWKEPAVSSENILFLTPERGAPYEEICGADLFVMSPPCQPYSRRKKSKHSSTKDRSGQEDPRTWSLHHLIDRMAADDAFVPRMLLLENVLGFENSASFERLTAMFAARSFVWQAFVLSPHMLGVPNSRPRLFVVAKRKSLSGNDDVDDDNDDDVRFPEPAWNGKVVQEEDPDPVRRQTQIEAAQHRAICWVEQGAILRGLLAAGAVSGDDLVHGDSAAAPASLATFLAPVSAAASQASLDIDSLTLWKAGNYFDVLTPASRRSHCFTKSYASFHGGAGSVICTQGTDADVARAYELFFEQRNALVAAAAPGKPDWAQVHVQRGGCPELEPLGLRYFAPQEIAQLLGFPTDFAFPPDITPKQQYALLGNSLSVHNVALLLRYMLAGSSSPS